MASPNRPGTELEIDDETKRILTERDKVFDEEEKNARPWSEVKAAILRQPLVS